MLTVKRKRLVYCRVCGKRAKSYSRAYPLANVTRRYFKCECGARFRTTEQLDPPRAK